MLFENPVLNRPARSKQPVGALQESFRELSTYLFEQNHPVIGNAINLTVASVSGNFPHTNYHYARLSNRERNNISSHNGMQFAPLPVHTKEIDRPDHIIPPACISFAYHTAFVAWMTEMRTSLLNKPSNRKNVCLKTKVKSL